MSILIFGGTAEGRLLAQWCALRGLPATLSVATEYGAAMAADPAVPDIRMGRLTQGEMEALMAGGFSKVVDATHPYAAEVTEHIRAAAAAAGLPCLRLTRDGDVGGEWLTAPDPGAAADLLEGLPGGILLTTGSKDLPAFARPGLRERCYPRVLPTVDSLERCLGLGFPPAHILCMQGPFIRALNEALLDQYHIRTLVTKATGRAGGFWEKAEAARNTGRALLVIDRPSREMGFTLEEIEMLLLGERQ